MKNRPVGQGYIQRDAGIRKDRSKDGMVVTMMSVLVVILVVRVASEIVIWMNAVMMVMVMRMKARGGHILHRVPMQPDRRRPSELERNDKHHDQDDVAAHGSNSTDSRVFTKCPIVPSLEAVRPSRFEHGLDKPAIPLKERATVIADAHTGLSPLMWARGFSQDACKAASMPSSVTCCATPHR